MREIKSGNISYIEGEPYEEPPYCRAYIEQEYEDFTLCCEKRGWNDIDGTEWACITITHCPWCGRDLRGDD